MHYETVWAADFVGRSRLCRPKSEGNRGDRVSGRRTRRSQLPLPSVVMVSDNFLPFGQGFYPRDLYDSPKP